MVGSSRLTALPPGRRGASSPPPALQPESGMNKPAEIFRMSPLPPAQGWAWGRAKRKLHSAGDCRQEAARIYKLAAKGAIPPEDLSRATYALTQIAKLAEQADLEERIAALEAMLAAKVRK